MTTYSRENQLSILEDSKGGTVTAAALTFQPAGRLQVALVPRIKLLIHTSPLHSIGSGGSYQDGVRARKGR